VWSHQGIVFGICWFGVIAVWGGPGVACCGRDGRVRSGLADNVSAGLGLVVAAVLRHMLGSLHAVVAFDQHVLFVVGVH